MRNKPIAVLCALVLLCTAALCACGKKNDSVAADGDVRLYTEGMPYTQTTKGTPQPVYALSYETIGGDDVMPIGGFYAPYAMGGSLDGNDKPDLLTDRYFQALEDCGINLMFYSPDRWETGAVNSNVVKALELCAAHNMGYYVDCFYVRNQLGTHTVNFPLEDMTLTTQEGKDKLREIVETIKHCGKDTAKSFVGILGNDEPFPSELDNLGVVREAFYGLDNTQGLDVYANALGYWANENTLWGYSDPLEFDAYIDQYFTVFGPKMLSATQYPYNSTSTPDSRMTTLLFDRLSKYRSYSNKYKVPHWRMLQAGGQWNDEAKWIDSKDPYPSEGELLFDVNASLAWGAKAIQYFPLVQPVHFAYQTGGTYDYENRNGLIGADGNLTRWYYFAQRANKQVQAIDEYLMHAANMGVLVHGKDVAKVIIEDGDPGDEVQRDGSFRQLTSVTGDDCIVGLFDYYGGTALYAVNYSRTEKADITLTFDKKDYRYTVIQRAQSCDVVGKSVPLTLDAGEGALIVLW